MVAARPRLNGKFGVERLDIIAEHEKAFGPCPQAHLTQVADHIDSLASIVGLTRVGIGFDVFGVPTTPVGLEDVTCCPNLLAELLRRGWSEDEVADVAGLNFIRVMQAVEDIAHRRRSHGIDAMARSERR